MAVTIRLARYGTTKRPFYRIVAASVAARRDGRFLEQIGTYDPAHQPPQVSLDRERIKYWISVGARPSSTVQTVMDAFMNQPDNAFRPSAPRKRASAVVATPATPATTATPPAES